MTAAIRHENSLQDRLHRRLRRELITVERTDRGTWTTSSNLPHEIRLQEQAGTEYLRVSAAMVMGVRATKALLMDINSLNVERAATRRIFGDGNIVVVAEMPVASLRPGDIDDLVSMTLSFARLDAPLLALHGGRSVTNPPQALAPDVHRPLNSWRDVLLASKTATAREFNVWLDAYSGIDCYLDREDSCLTVILERRGLGADYPFCLELLKENLEELQEEAEDEEDNDDEDD
jgi:hypothetical protein